MSITRTDIKNACFITDVREAEDLALNNRGLVDLGCICEATNLTTLNLAFNSLVSAAALSSLTSLVSLNLSHNSLAVCSKSLSSLTALTHLNASHNKLVNITGLSACCGLQELWLQHNRLSAVSELQPLSTLPGLMRLVISPNPLGKQLGAAQLRATLAAMCPQLKVLDGLPITDSEREAGQQVSPSTWARPGSTNTSGRTSPAGPTADRLSDSSTPPPATGQGQADVMLGFRAPRAGGGAPTGIRRGGRAGATGRVAPRPAAGVLSADPGGGSPDRGWQLPDVNPAGGGDSLPDQDAASDAGTSYSGLSWQQDPGSTRQQQREARARHNGGVPKIKQLPATSKFQSVLAALPDLDHTRLPPAYSPSKLAATRPRKAPPAPPPPDANVTAYELKYPVGARGRAVRTCRDGSVCMSWPNGDLAITVDADHATQPPTYRMLALYRQTGNVACSWDTSGGFVQYPNGSVCLNCSSGGATGTLFSPTGEVLLKWDDQGSAVAAVSGGADDEQLGWPALAPASDEAASQAEQQIDAAEGASSTDGETTTTLPALAARGGRASDGGITAPDGVIKGARASSDTGGAKSGAKASTALKAWTSQTGWPPPVDMALDMHLGVRFSRRYRQLQIYLSCDGVQYKVVCGHNHPAALWQVGHMPEDAEAAPVFLKQLTSGTGAGEVRQAMMRTQKEQTQAADAAAQAASEPSQDNFANVLAGLSARIQGLLAQQP